MSNPLDEPESQPPDSPVPGEPRPARPDWLVGSDDGLDARTLGIREFVPPSSAGLRRLAPEPPCRSAAVTLPLSLPLQAPLRDIAWLALLGMFQLAIPCILAVRAARVLPAPELALLTLLESVFGIAWVWLATDEQPTLAVALGGALVLAALAVNQWLGLREQRGRVTEGRGQPT